MRIPTTAQVGCVVFLAAIIGFLGTKHWVESRTLRAVDMPVSLARGIVSTGTFNLNSHGFYSILIGEEQGGNPQCNVELETRRISSIGGLPVYRYQWLDDESRSTGRNTIAGFFLGGFEGKPGNYDLEIEIVSDTGCLDASMPRLYILASNDDFARLNNRYENAFWISFVSGSLGLGLLIIGIRERFRRRSTDNRSIDFFEPARALHNYPTLHRVRVAPWIPFFSQIGLLYSQSLLLLVISGVLVFHYAWGHDRRSQGLFVAVGLSPMMENWMCGESWSVRIDARENWYLNSTKTSQKELAGALSQRLGDKTNCTVYLDVDPSLPYAVAIEAIATIQKTPAQAKVVVLLTPKTKKVAPLRTLRQSPI